MTYNADELIDLVDERDIVQLVEWRSKSRPHAHLYVRAVLAFLVDRSSGRLCFLRRADHKTYAPGHWAIVGGCVQSGETYDQAAAREIAEEINIEVNSRTIRHLGLVTPQEYPGRYFNAVYEVAVNDEGVVYNNQDFSAALWMTPCAWRDFARQTKDPLVHDLLYLLNRFYP